MTQIENHTLASLRDALKNKELTSIEATDAYLSRIEAAKELNTFITLTADKARDMAKASDEKLASGKGGDLEGVPLGIKDLFCTEGVLTTAASHILDGFKPEYESRVSGNLFADGAVMLGKLNLDEFAMGSSNETSFYGNVINPWRRNGDDTPLTPGGSSGGSSSAVAAGLVAGATGTDYGRCSRWGIVAFASSLDQAGPITRDVKDAAIMLKSMAGYDEKDSTCIDRPVPDYESVLGQSINGLRIGIPKEYRVDGMPAEIETLWRQGIEWMKDAGCEIVDISLPLTKYALPVYYIVAPAEASSNLARYDGVKYGLRAQGDMPIQDMYEQTRAEGFGNEVKRRVMIGTYVLSAGYYDAYYLRAQKVRKLISNEFNDAFNKVDLILTPSAPSAAFGLGEKTGDPVAMYLNDIFTVTANLAGLPGASVPAGLDAHGLPLGLQLIGKPFDEETLFKGSYVLEQAADFNARPHDWWA